MCAGGGLLGLLDNAPFLMRLRRGSLHVSHCCLSVQVSDTTIYLPTLYPGDSVFTFSHKNSKK